MSPIIDAQVHVYDRDGPWRPWVGSLEGGPASATGDETIAAMDAVGVDGAIVVSSWTHYRFDPSYAREVHARHPRRFALVTPVDPRDPDVADIVAAWARVPGAVGVRLVLLGDPIPTADDPGVDRLMSAAASRDLPVSLLAPPDFVGRLAARHPDTQLVVDHLGLHQPFKPPPPDEPFARLPEVLALASHPNIAMKVTGVPSLSHEPYPFRDVWEPMARVFDAFGIERCMWGSDWTRTITLATYDESTDFVRELGLDVDERDALMGGSLTRVFRWAPASR